MVTVLSEVQTVSVLHWTYS